MMSVVSHRQIKRVALNATRLAAGFGFGMVTLWGFDRLGLGFLAAYLLFLGYRWIFAIPAIALEAAALPLIGRGQSSGLSRWILTLMIGIGCLGALVAAASDQGRATITAATCLAMLQLGTAPALAGLMVSGAARAHAILTGARRATDPVALGIGVLWADHPDQIFPVFLWVLVGLSVGIAAAVLYFWFNRIAVFPSRPVLSIRRIIISSIVVAASQVVALRLPVLISALALAPQQAVQGALGFVIGGYIRQVATVFLIGLDAESFHASPGGGRPVWISQTRKRTLLSVTFLIIVLLIFWQWVEGRTDPAKQAVFVSLILIGTGYRILADVLTKLLSGQARQQEIVSIAAILTVATTSGYGFVVWALPDSAVLTGVAMVFCAGQIFQSIWFLAKMAEPRVSPVAPSSPAG